jgi:hypothetical protein
MNQIVTDAIANRLLDSMIGIAETRRNIDSSIDESRCITLTPLQILNYKKSFYYNTGNVSDGKYIRLSEKEIYFRIPVNMSMIKNYSQEESFIYHAHTRAKEKKPSLFVFINGYKIPDSEILFYPTRTNADIFIPDKYITPAGCEIIIQKKIFEKYHYVRYYTPKTSSQSISFQTGNDSGYNLNINEKTVIIYIDKKLYTGGRNVFFVNNKTITIELLQELYNNEIEVIVDEGIKDFFIQTGTAAGNRAVFEIPETYLDSIHGPISKFSCYFYADGKKLSNDAVIQQGRLHFSYAFNEASTPALALYISDMGCIDDSRYYLYGSDYYLYNMIGARAISSVFQEGKSNTIFDGYIDFTEVLSNNEALYDRNRINALLTELHNFQNPDDKITYLLKDRPYLMRNFLENYGEKVYTYTINYNGTDPYVYIGFNDVYEIGDEFSYEMNINAVHVPSNEYRIIKRDITDVFKINSSVLRVGENTVEIEVIKNSNLEYIKVEPQHIGFINEANVLTIHSFKKVIDTQDIIVLEKVTRNEHPEYRYANESGIGYRPLTDIEINYNAETKVITIVFHERPENQIIVYNTNFTVSYRYKKTMDSSVTDITIPIYAGTETEPVPFIAKGKVTVYAGNDKLLDGIDYYIKHPFNEHSVAGSFIILTRAILPGTLFDIYISGVKANKIIDIPGYFANNPYGLIYLGTLEYPVSLKYLNIYINNRKCTEDDIDILSDKLIRIHSIPVPLYDLSVETKFAINAEYLEPYIALYNEDSFERTIETLFKGVWFNRPYVYGENNPNYNAIYESFINTVDSVFKRPNPVSEDSEWFTSDSAASGVHNDGTAIGGTDIFTSIIAGGRYIIAGSEGRAASYDIHRKIWNTYNEGGILTSDGSCFNRESILSSVFYHGYIIFGTSGGRIGFYNLITNVWYYPGDTQSGILLNRVTPQIFEGAIYAMIVLNGLLIIAGENGNVASFDLTRNRWYNYTDSEASGGVAARNLMGTIYTMQSAQYENKTALLLFGENGEVASGFITANAFTKPDGTRQTLTKAGPPIYSDGESRDFSDIHAVISYLDYKVMLGNDGIVTYFDTTNCSFIGFNDSKNISNHGSHNGYKNINAAVLFEKAVIISGADNGHIDNYTGDSQKWNEYTSRVGITNIGESMQYNAIYTIASYTADGFNDIIFAGANGKVCSYHLNEYTAAFRYDPYKTQFLLWYTAPGNAYIKTTWELPEEAMRLFSIYKDSDDHNYDINLGAGDTDITVDITLNELDKYPRTHEERTLFMAQFIASLPEGRYTKEEIWEKYMASDSHKILYPWDVIPLASGNLIPGEEDIILT